MLRREKEDESSQSRRHFSLNNVQRLTLGEILPGDVFS